MPPSRYALAKAKIRSYGRGAKAETERYIAQKLAPKNAAIRELKSPAKAAGNSAIVLAGAAACGAFQAKAPAEAKMPLDVPAEVLAGVLLAGIGMGSKKTALIYFATGVLAPAVAQYVEDSMEPAPTQ